MVKIRIRNAISLLMNILNIVLVTISIFWYFGDAGMATAYPGSKCFVFFTNDSNILAAICCLVIVPFNIISIVRGQDVLPKWALIIKFVGTSAVTLTLLVVLFFLGPLTGYTELLSGIQLLLHLVCPLLCIISLGWFERGSKINFKQAFFGIIPETIYGTIYLINVIFRKTWVDFYQFNRGGRWYITYIIFPFITYAICLINMFLHNRKLKNIKKD